METTSKSPEETSKIAKNFVQNIEPNTQSATVVGLYGELGAGKTTFMKAVAETFGVGETVQSPTFVIEKIYELPRSENQKFTHLIHIDAYRIDDDKELLNLGWKKIVSDSNNLIFIEWPERVSGILPGHTKIKFNHISEQERRIVVES